MVWLSVGLNFIQPNLQRFHTYLKIPLRPWARVPGTLSQAIKYREDLLLRPETTLPPPNRHINMSLAGIACHGIISGGDIPDTSRYARDIPRPRYREIYRRRNSATAICPWPFCLSPR